MYAHQDQIYSYLPNATVESAIMPKIIGPIPYDKWEKRVWNELQNRLPASWRVVSNVSYQWKNTDGYLRDGQADFVVLAPGLGLAVVEVKGTKKIWVDDDGIWNKIGWNGEKLKLKEPPPEQACRNMHNLSSRVAVELKEAVFPGLFGWLVVYPNGEVQGKLDTYLPSSVVQKKDLHKIKHAIENVLRERGNATIGKKFTDSYTHKVAQILSNANFIVNAVDTELDVIEEGDDIDKLTRQQFAALRGAFDLPSVSVVGPAGSGKTILAMWKLEAMIASGRKALFVCYNTALADYLRYKHHDIASNIVSIDNYFLAITEVRPQIGNDFFRTKLPELAYIPINGMSDSEKFDAIIVDEGQDFGLARLQALYFLLKDSGSSQWLVFSDQRQNLYQGEQTYEIEAEVTFRLYENCRNTKKLNSATNAICKTNVIAMEGVPAGIMPSVELCKREYMAQKVWLLASELSPDGGAVILSPYMLHNSCMKDSTKGHGLELTTDINFLGKSGYVFFSTIKSFKGLEAGHVIFIHADVPEANKALSDEDIYVAFTRASTRLDVLTSQLEAQTWYESQLSALSS